VGFPLNSVFTGRAIIIKRDGNLFIHPEGVQNGLPIFWSKQFPSDGENMEMENFYIIDL
jgi:hypothetical protein